MGLNKLGVKIPYIDNLHYFVKTKTAKLKIDKATLNKKQVVPPLLKPNRKIIKPLKTVHNSLYKNDYKGNLKI